MQRLKAISPIDGRYHEKTEILSQFFSEEALIKYRIIIEGEYLLGLSNTPGVGLRKFSAKEKNIIRTLSNLKEKDISRVKEIEAATNHDVKAIEYFIKEKLKKTTLSDSLEWIHFALTSEDTNNMSYALMLSDSLAQVILPVLEEINAKMENFAVKNKAVVAIARTHGQAASPTTIGKEFKVFAARLARQIKQLKNFKIQAKLNGATGNYNAHRAAYPKVNWMRFTETFVAGFNTSRKVKLKTNLITTQIESHDTYAELFSIMQRINTILIDFDQDIWRYISDNWIIQKLKKGEVGSSTMPHKVNPIDFENSEGNLGIANVLFSFFANKLPISRLQRDLSDSTVERNFGVALAHSLIAYKSILKGLEKINLNYKKMAEEVENHPEVVAEAIQTILRREKYPIPYEQLKELTRGKKCTLQDFEKFINGLHISKKIKQELHSTAPQNYTGIAEKLAILNKSDL
ncbi:MAG: adenylosuccinate lyase [Parcubacteria group bacterium]|jgi:adenylosuccinate lyase